MKRTPLKRRHPKQRRLERDWSDTTNDPETVFREDVHRRSRGRCELCGRRPATQIHHRRTRAEEWSRWLDVNGLDLCRACHHDVIHANVEWAMRHMLILSRHSTTHPAPIVGCGLDCERDHRP